MMKPQKLSNMVGDESTKPFGYSLEKQNSCKDNAQANPICSTFAFAQPHPRQ